MIEPSRFTTAPVHVRALDFGHVAVLVNYRNGHVQCLLPAAATLWRDAAATGHLDLIPPVLANRLLAAGLLIRTATPTPWPAPLTAKAATAGWRPTRPGGWGSEQGARGRGTSRPPP